MADTLILYTSKSGVTRDIAQTIKSHLNGKSTVVNLKDFDESVLFSCQSIVLGAPIYMGYIRKPMRRFVIKHLETLLKKDVYLFIVGVDTDIDLDKYLAMSYPKEIIAHAKLKKHLGGEFRAESRALFSRFIMQRIKEEFAKERDIEEAIDTDKILEFARFIDKKNAET